MTGEAAEGLTSAIRPVKAGKADKVEEAVKASQGL